MGRSDSALWIDRLQRLSRATAQRRLHLLARLVRAPKGHQHFRQFLMGGGTGPDADEAFVARRRFRKSSRIGEDRSELVIRSLMLRVRLDRLLQTGDGLVHASLLREHNSETHSSRRKSSFSGRRRTRSSKRRHALSISPRLRDPRRPSHIAIRAFVSSVRVAQCWGDRRSVDGSLRAVAGHPESRGERR
jgi:hypothetical protein